MELPPPRVLLLAMLDSVGVTRLPQLFHEAGCDVSLFAPSWLAVCRSRFLQQHFPAEAAPVAYLEQLRRHLRAHPYDWVVVCDEILLWALAESATDDKLLQQCLPVHGYHAALIASKHQFLTAAAQAGLPVPPLMLCDSVETALDAAQQIGYPAILRAQHSLGGSGVRLASSKEELVAYYHELSAQSAVAVQRYIADARTVMTEVLYDHGRLVAWHSSYLVAGWPNAMTASCVREPMDHPAIEPLLRQLGTLTGFHGLAGVDWLHHPAHDQWHLVEFNPRPTPGYHLGHSAGINYAAALREMLSGQCTTHRPHLPPGAQPHQYLFPQYLYRALDDHTYSQLGRVWRDVPWRDPRLLLSHLRRVSGHYLPSHWRERVRQWRTAFHGQKAVRA